MSLKFQFLFIIIFTTQLYSQPQKADYFIAKDLSSFEILNRYQQKMSTTEKQKLPEFTPWKIRNKNMILGDRFTHAMQVEYNGAFYFFSLNEDGTFKNNPETFNEIFEDCRIIDDNVTVSMEKGVLFREIPFSKKSGLPRIYLKKGTELKRLFKKGQSYFIKNMSSGVYGWVRINNSSAITAINISKPEQTTNIGTDVYAQVEKKVNKINDLYRQLFNHLNSEYGDNKTVPFWKIQSSEDHILLTLHNVDSYKLMKSNAYFLNDIEHIFIGHKVFIENNPGSIKINLKNEN